MKRLLACLLICVCAFGSLRAEEWQSVGLVLSGGGAKGIAHIGVIKALEDNDIPIDYVTGTSMGAIVGGLYASGYSPDEMMQLLESKSFSYWSTGKIDPNLIYYFSERPTTPAIVNLNLGERRDGGSSVVLPTSLINPLPMSFAFMDLFSAYTAQCGGDFDKLFVPFRCVTSDVTAKHKVVCSSGSLGDAIRASMSFPLVFYPLKKDGVLLYDGGIYDNFPVGVMRDDFAPSIMIGVDVSTPSKDPNSRNLMSQLENMIMQHNDYNLPADEGIKIHIDLNEFGLLDFPKAREIYDIGYARGLEMIDSIKSRIHSRMPAETLRVRRDVFKSQTPYVHFDSVTVSGGTPSQDAYIRYLFTHNKADTFGIEQARDSYYRAITPGKFTSLLPQAVYNDSTGLFKLDLKATVKDRFNVGFGGYVSTSTSSMLFLSGAYRTLSLNSLDVGANIWVGQSYNAVELQSKINILTDVPSSLRLEGVASRQKFYENEKMFFDDKMPTFVLNSEYFGRLYYTMAAGRSAKAEIGAGFGHLVDKYYENWMLKSDKRQRDRTMQNLGQIVARYDFNTLNAPVYPTSGSRIQASAMGVYGRLHYSILTRDGSMRDKLDRSWWQVEVDARHYWSPNRHFSLGADLNILASSRRLFGSYTSSIVDAPAFYPTASSYNTFDPDFRCFSYAAAGLEPIWKIGSMFQLRGSLNLFVPIRPIEADALGMPHFGRWFSKADFFGEVTGVVALPFGSVTAYANYATTPANRWSFGLSLGVFVLAPKLLR